MSKELATPEHVFRHWKTWVVVSLRFLIGGLFLFSGFVKGVDIWGVGYKLADYATSFEWQWALPLIGLGAVLLPLYEFVFGFLLFIGSFRRASVIALMAMMAVMLPLTAYIALYNPVTDCGCFGDVWVISNVASFWKNVALTVGLILLLLWNRSVRSFYGPAVQWMTVVFPAVYLLIVMGWGYYVQPMIDFRPYKVGMCILEDASTEQPDFSFVYRKGSVERAFPLDSLPDSTWTFIDRKEVAKTVAKNATDSVRPIAIFEGDKDVASEVIPKEGEVLLLLVPDIKDIDVASTFRINELYEEASESGISVVCLASGTDAEIEEWRTMSLADYPIYKMDDSELKTIARGNPALVGVKDGRIQWKSTFYPVDIDNIGADSGPGELSFADYAAGRRMLLFLTVVLALAMGGLLLLNRSIVLIKFGLQWRRNKNKGVNLPKNKNV